MTDASDDLRERRVPGKGWHTFYRVPLHVLIDMVQISDPVIMELLVACRTRSCIQDFHAHIQPERKDLGHGLVVVLCAVHRGANPILGD